MKEDLEDNLFFFACLAGLLLFWGGVLICRALAWPFRGRA